MRSLLLRNISFPQILAFFVANLLGLFLLLLAVQLYSDMKPLFMGDEGVLKSEYVVVTKEVSLLSNLDDAALAFDENEVNDIKLQPFVETLGEFVPSEFSVTAAIQVPGTDQQFSTQMFFESVPDEFVDVDKKKWAYEVGDEIPIVLPRNYLNLYNFGFAQTKGLPKITEGIISSLPIHIFVSDKNGYANQEHHIAHVVGFSNRLNTILVPSAFIKVMNSRFTPQGTNNPSRLILKISNPADKRVSEYFKNHELVLETDNMESSKLSWVFQTVIICVIALGGIVCVIAFYMLMLSIYLLVQKNKEKLKTLLLLGYTESQVATPYIMLSVVMNILVAILAIIVLLVVRAQYLDFITEIYPNLDAGSVLPTLVVCALTLLVIALLNVIIIRKKVTMSKL